MGPLWGHVVEARRALDEATTQAAAGEVAAGVVIRRAMDLAHAVRMVEAATAAEEETG